MLQQYQLFVNIATIATQLDNNQSRVDSCEKNVPLGKTKQSAKSHRVRIKLHNMHKQACTHMCTHTYNTETVLHTLQLHSSSQIGIFIRISFEKQKQRTIKPISPTSGHKCRNTHKESSKWQPRAATQNGYVQDVLLVDWLSIPIDLLISTSNSTWLRFSWQCLHPECTLHHVSSEDELALPIISSEY